MQVEPWDLQHFSTCADHPRLGYRAMGSGIVCVLVLELAGIELQCGKPRAQRADHFEPHLNMAESLSGDHAKLPLTERPNRTGGTMFHISCRGI